MSAMKINRKIKHFAAIVVAFAAVAVACMELKTINIDQPQPDGTMAPRIKAGEVATFVMGCELNAQADHLGGRKLIVGILAPRDWDIAKNIVMTAQASAGLDPETIYEFEALTSATLPKNKQQTWPDLLMEKMGMGPNLYNDMEWVAFQCKTAVPITNGDKFVYDVTIKCKVGMSNLKACLGFYINHDDDGHSGDTAHYKCVFSDPFTVYGGEGEEIDYTKVRFNSVVPSRALENDLITFTFNGEAFDNDLVRCDKIYFTGTAIAEDGTTYTCASKKEMKKEDFTDVYNCTVWPRKFFNVPADKTIVAVKYEFVNADGSTHLNKWEEEKISGGTPDESIPLEERLYTLNLRCE